ncbi:protein PLASTID TRANSCRIPTIONALLY ACTIVE 16, chloroplastic [Aristolochia californica]|uniref:protein PLASTID TRANSCRIPTIONALLY ACTIVE 16, chloroplastic n=1 Tax=Aristolochia californica TaxID=171875 RepID=UPI0035E01D9A
MAPTLTSNSFLLTAPLPSKAAAKSLRSTSHVFAKLNSPFPPFRIGKREDDSEAQSQESGKGNNSFFVDFGKIPDVKSLLPVVRQPSTLGISRRKDPRTVFVAGATGQAGVRIAQTLLRQGFAVRAGVPELAAAQELARLAAQYKLISTAEFRRLNAVESGFQDAESIAKAIGNAAKVVVTIGYCENGPNSPLTTSDALKVVQAAQLAGVGHVAIVYDNSSMAAASTYNVLDGITSFLSNLFTKSQPLTFTELLQEIVETDVSYTVIKASLTDDFSKEYSGNVVVAAEGSGGANQYKVSKSQIAELVAGVFSNTSLAENKVVEVSTDPSASSKSAETLFSAVPEDGRRKAYAEALTKAKAEEEALIASEKAREAAAAAKNLEDEVKKLSQKEAQAAKFAEQAEEKAKAAGSSVENLLSKAKNMSDSFSWDKLSSQITNSVPLKIDDLPKPKFEMPKTQIATFRGQAKAQSLTPNKAVVKRPAPKPKSKQAEPEAKGQKPEVRNVFGGLFKQETIYVDDD